MINSNIYDSNIYNGNIYDSNICYSFIVLININHIHDK